LALACAAKAALGGKWRFSWERFSIESPVISVLITLQITREYQQAEGFGDVAKKIRGMIPSLEIKIKTS
jgi:hypothetical protein